MKDDLVVRTSCIVIALLGAMHWAGARAATRSAGPESHRPGPHAVDLSSEVPTTNPRQGTVSRAGADTSSLRVALLDPRALAAMKRRLQAGSSPFDAALTKLLGEAEQAARVKLLSVIDKAAVPPSGDKHDYISLSRYWWPNPNTPDGLPYIHRDGEVNPEIRKIPDE